MITIKFSTGDPEIPIARQTPGSKGIWGDCRFIIDKPTERADWWFVYDGLAKPETAICPPEHTVLITSESDDTKRYNQKYLKQFSYLITSQRQNVHPGIVNTAQGQTWMIGHMGGRSGVDPKDFSKYFTPYDTLSGIKEIKKDKLISVFSSGKARTQGQQLRLAFVEALKKHFGDRLDVYGVFEKYVADKWNGIAPYKYHITLENSHRDDYWTEKLSDAFIAGAYPLYWGAPNIYAYFPKESLTTLDLSDFDGAIAEIERAIAENRYEKNLEAVWAARRLVLDKYNVFAIMHDFAHSHASQSLEERKITLRPENQSAMKFKNWSVKTVKKFPMIRTVAKKLYRYYRNKRYGQQFNPRT